MLWEHCASVYAMLGDLAANRKVQQALGFGCGSLGLHIQSNCASLHQMERHEFCRSLYDAFLLVHGVTRKARQGWTSILDARGMV